MVHQVGAPVERRDALGSRAGRHQMGSGHGRRLGCAESVQLTGSHRESSSGRFCPGTRKGDLSLGQWGTGVPAQPAGGGAVPSHSTAKRVQYI